MMLVAGGVNLSQNLVDLGKQLLEACKNGNTDEVKSLMQSGAPFSTDWLGASPLHFAAQNGHADTIEVLLRAGVSRDTRTKVDRTPLHVAAQEGHVQIVNLLVTHGADIEAKDLLRMTPLHWAVERGYTDIVQSLLTHGADVEAENKFDKTAFDIAYESGHSDIVPILQRYVSKSSPRPKSETKPVTPANSKTRPIVLPNKATRTPKIIKPQPAAANVKQVFHVNQKGLTIENLKKLLSSGGSSAESLSALTTNNHTNGKNSDADAVRWLETQGLAMSAAENDSLVDTAIESGNSLKLTEAGKLTLNWVKNQNVNPSQAGTKKYFTVNNNVRGGPGIILVTNQSAGQHQLESQKVVTAAGNSSGNNITSRKVPAQLLLQQQQTTSAGQKIKISKPVTIAMIPNSSLAFGRNSNQSPRQKQTAVVNEVQSIDLEEEEEHEDGDEDRMRKQLDDERKQFKAQLAEKDREIERLKKQVSDLSAKVASTAKK